MFGILVSLPLGTAGMPPAAIYSMELSCDNPVQGHRTSTNLTWSQESAFVFCHQNLPGPLWPCRLARHGRAAGESRPSPLPHSHQGRWRRQHLLIIAMVESYSGWRDLSSLLRSKLPVAMDPRIRQVIGLMRQGMARELDVDGLAASTGLSRAHFFTLFQRDTRVTLLVYVDVLRIEAAIGHLTRSQDSAGDVSHWKPSPTRWSANCEASRRWLSAPPRSCSTIPGAHRCRSPSSSKVTATRACAAPTISAKVWRPSTTSAAPVSTAPEFPRTQHPKGRQT